MFCDNSKNRLKLMIYVVNGLPIKSDIVNEGFLLSGLIYDAVSKACSVASHHGIIHVL